MGEGTTNPSVLDLAQLEDATGGEAELIQELSELYLMDVAAQFGDLSEAVGSRNLEHVYRIAHGLKGSSASIGAAEAAGAFRALEMLGRQGASAGLGEALCAAKEAVDRVRSALAEL